MLILYMLKIAYSIMYFIYAHIKNRFFIDDEATEHAYTLLHQVFFSDLISLTLEGYFEFVIAGYLTITNPLFTNTIEIA